MAMPSGDGLRLIRHAMQEREEDFLRQRWVAGYQHMPFEEFKRGLSARADTRKEADILADVKSILNMAR